MKIGRNRQKIIHLNIKITPAYVYIGFRDRRVEKFPVCSCLLRQCIVHSLLQIKINKCNIRPVSDTLALYFIYRQQLVERILLHIQIIWEFNTHYIHCREQRLQHLNDGMAVQTLKLAIHCLLNHRDVQEIFVHACRNGGNKRCFDTHIVLCEQLS